MARGTFHARSPARLRPLRYRATAAITPRCYNGSRTIGYNNAFVAAESHRNYYLSLARVRPLVRVISFPSNHRSSCGRSPTAFELERTHNSSLPMRERIANRPFRETSDRDGGVFRITYHDISLVLFKYPFFFSFRFIFFSPPYNRGTSAHPGCRELLGNSVRLGGPV